MLQAFRPACGQNNPNPAFLLSLAAGEGQALAHLLLLAAALRQDEGDLEVYEPRPGCQAYPAFLTWPALHGARLLPLLEARLTASEAIKLFD